MFLQHHRGCINRETLFDLPITREALYLLAGPTVPDELLLVM